MVQARPDGVGGGQERELRGHNLSHRVRGHLGAENRGQLQSEHLPQPTQQGEVYPETTGAVVTTECSILPFYVLSYFIFAKTMCMLSFTINYAM